MTNRSLWARRMIEIDGVVVAGPVLDTRFACDLAACRGICCRLGDLGAPLAGEEVESIRSVLPDLAPWLGPARTATLLADGFVEEWEGSLHVKETGRDQPCPLGFEGHDGILYCALHRYAVEHTQPVTSVKPLWCSLFPLMVRRSGDLWQVDVELRPECRSVADPPRLIEFMKPRLVELFGEAWFDELSAVPIQPPA